MLIVENQDSFLRLAARPPRDHALLFSGGLLAGRFSEEGAYPMKTVENVLYELVGLGALHRVGKPGHTRVPDTRALKTTALGRAWLARDLLPLPGPIEDQ